MSCTRLNISLAQFDIGLSGAVPGRDSWSEPAMDRAVLEFVALFSGIVFKYGGRIVHGSHPTFTPVILRQARLHAGKERSRKPVILIMSELWAKNLPKQFIDGLVDVAEFVVTKQIGDGGPENVETRNRSLTEMRRLLIQNQNLMVAVGGKMHEKDGAIPGVREEMDLAAKKGIPRFLIASMGGYAAEYAKELAPSSLHNGLNTHTEAKLARLWIALRELGSMPPEKDCPEEFLLLWNDVLGKWASNAAWYGLHGPAFLSQLAALYSIAKVRNLLQSNSSNRHPPELVEHPGGGLASALYSTAKLMPSSEQRQVVFEDGLAHLNRSIQQHELPSAGLIQLRASFHLQMGNRPRAVEDFEDALKRRYAENAGPSQIGESMSELGFAYLHQLRLFRGLELLKEGAVLLEIEKDIRPGFYVRGLRKLACGLH